MRGVLAARLYVPYQQDLNAKPLKQVAGAGTDEWGGGEGKQLLGEGSGALGAVRELFISPLNTPAKDQAARC
jgi:hypothetical protein